MPLGQTIDTPVDIARNDPDPRDRPYAGTLHGMLTLDRRTAGHLDRFAVQAGMIGLADLRPLMRDRPSAPIPPPAAPT